MAADVGAAVRTFVIAQSSVNTLIGSGASARMYPDMLPQGSSLPAIAYWRVSTIHDQYLGRLSGMAAARIQFDCFASTRAGANALAEALKDCGLMNMRGVYSGCMIHAVELDSGQRHYIDAPSDGSDEHRYVSSQDFIFHYQE